MKIHKLIATALGSGYSPLAPGTAGSIVGIVILFFVNLLYKSFGFQQPVVLILNFGLITAITFLGVSSIKKVHKIWEHDASKIVIDEVVGVWIAAFAVPLRWEYYLYALILFRFFDIVKPFYIRSIDKHTSDWSVMMDDVLAGVYAFIVLHCLIFFEVVQA